MTDGISIIEIKRLAWVESGRNLYMINIAKANTGWDHSKPETPYMCNKLLQEVRRLKSTKLATAAVVPRRRQYPIKAKPARIIPETLTASPIPNGTNEYDQKTMRCRYSQAHLKWFQQQYPNGYKDGHYLAPDYPKIHTSNGITDLIMNYLKWMGHFSNRTNNIGRSRVKVAPKFNIHSGKVENIMIGTTYIKSTSKRGMQDIDSNLKHPRHEYGIPWKIEVKCRATRDTPSDQQEAYAAKVEATGAVYSMVRDDIDFFMIYDGIMK